jgi:hypothetical protein
MAYGVGANETDTGAPVGVSPDKWVIMQILDKQNGYCAA